MTETKKPTVFDWCTTLDEFVTELGQQLRNWREAETTPAGGCNDAWYGTYQHLEGLLQFFPWWTGLQREAVWTGAVPAEGASDNIGYYPGRDDVVFPVTGQVSYNSIQLDEVARMMLYRLERLAVARGEGPVVGRGERQASEAYTVDRELVQAIDDLLERPVRPADILTTYVEGADDSYAQFTPRQPSEDEQMAWAIRESMVLGEEDLELQQALLASMPDVKMVENDPVLQQALLDSMPDEMIE
eukprot:CAMPEP_0172157244 /NCGR_PEP_ID=MMETSP1050-20130122/3675_1 /TAXON_ID=233186 /ORGANISM="Cryptomonas curvata, Strain CCAP979/52" /LENGTH=243 /DNA_ID=CAMNT_0012826435 /DNA_START=20 /DNA_END=752 /DNA_ORIENTATION=+